MKRTLAILAIALGVGLLVTANYSSLTGQQVETFGVQRSSGLQETLEAWLRIVGGLMGSVGGFVSLVVTIRRERRESLAAAKKP